MDRTVQRGNVDARWVQTLQQVSDPALTVHEPPPATAEELKTLCRSIAQIRTDDTIAMSANTVPSKGRNSAPATGGLVGQDTFTFEGVLGKGGMGTVYNARQEGMSRVVAVKTLLDEGLEDPSSIASFLREALTTGFLAHPNIIPVHFFGRDEQDRPFMVMKRVQGRPWSDILAQDGADRSKEFDLRRHLEIFAKVCDAVAFAHAQHILHRDLKPANVMIGDFGEVTLMDWGLALDISPDPNRALALRPEQASMVAGTPAYMAPEMVRCDMKKLSPATDIYLLGAILHEILTSKPPHYGKDVLQVMQHALAGIANERITPRPNLPRESRELERMIRNAMAQESADRYESVKKFAEDIDNFLAGQGDRDESEALAQAARNELTALAKETEDLINTSPFYPRCTEILAKTQQSLALWGFNPRAVRVRQETQALFADLAIRGKDWGLAESVLRDLKLTGSGSHALAGPLETRLRVLRDKARDRDSLTRRTARLAMLFAGIMIVVAAYLYWKLWEAKVDLASARSEVFKSSENSEQGPVRSVNLGVQSVKPSQPDPIITEGSGKTEPPLPVAPPDENPSEKPPTQTTAAQKKAPPELLPAWRLPGESVVEQIAVSPDDIVLMRDAKGALWLWYSNAEPDTARNITPPAAKTVTRCAWAGPRTAVAIAADGALYTVDVPASERGLLQPWNARTKVDPDLSAFAVEGGQKPRWAIGKDGAVHLSDDETMTRRPAGGAVLALQYLPKDVLLCASRREVLAWTPPNRVMKFNLNEDFALAVCAAEAPVIAMVAEKKRSEIHIFRPQLETGKGERMSISLRAPVANVALSRSGLPLAVATEKGEIMIVAGQPPAAVAQFSVSDAPSKSMAFSADGKRLYAGMADGSIHVFKAEKP